MPFEVLGVADGRYCCCAVCGRGGPDMVTTINYKHHGRVIGRATLGHIKNAPFTVVGRADPFSLCAICGQAGAELQILHRSHLDVWHLQMCAGIFCSGCARATRLPENIARSRLEDRTADPCCPRASKVPAQSESGIPIDLLFPGKPRAFTQGRNV